VNALKALVERLACLTSLSMVLAPGFGLMTCLKLLVSALWSVNVQHQALEQCDQRPLRLAHAGQDCLQRVDLPRLPPTRERCFNMTACFPFCPSAKG
jgi:hypothetical protein